MNKLFSVTLLALAASFASFAQNKLTATTTSAVIASGDKTISVTSATGIAAPVFNTATPGTQLFVVDPGQIAGEVMNVTAVSGTTITVLRTTKSRSHISGAMVLAGLPQYFYKSNPTGACTAASTYVTPVVNTITGEQWLCSTITLGWVPGWGNPLTLASAQVTAAVADAAALAINGPLQHVTSTGTSVTSFVMGVGWNGQGFSIIPDSTPTISAGNNIALGSTAVANKTLGYTYDFTNSKFVPSY